MKIDKMKGHIRIGNSHNNFGDPKTIHVVIEDDSSMTQFFEGWMTPEEFARSITGGSGEILFSIHYVDRIGKIREFKTEIVDVPKHWMFEGDIEKSKELLAPFEVDGWMGSVYDLSNHHNLLRDRDAVKVTFVRFVDKKENK